MADVLEVGANVATPLGLVGLVVTALLLAYYRRLKHQEKQLQLLPEEKRALAVDTLLSRYAIDGSNLTRKQKYDMIRREMERRADHLRLLIIVSALLFAFCFALGVVAYVAKADQPKQVPQTTDPSKSIQNQLLWHNALSELPSFSAYIREPNGKERAHRELVLVSLLRLHKLDLGELLNKDVERLILLVSKASHDPENPDNFLITAEIRQLREFVIDEIRKKAIEAGLKE